MKNPNIEITKLLFSEFILSVFDVSAYFYWGNRGLRCNINRYLSIRSKERHNIIRKIKYWRDKGIVRSYLSKNKYFIELTDQGKKYLYEKEQANIKIRNQSKWDKKWRLVIYDIPEKYRFKRDIFRRKLQYFGFYKMQKSVYIFPFECTQALKPIIQKLDLEKYVILSISDSLQNEEKLIEHFSKLKQINLKLLNNNN